MNKLLLMKHWQLFIFALLPICILVISPFFINQINIFVISIIAILTNLLIIFLWFWSIINILSKSINENLKFNLIFAKITLFFSNFFYLFIFSTFFVKYPFENTFFLIPYIIILIMVFLGNFYLLFIIAKIITVSFNQKKISFGEILGNMFLIMYFPIGIWFIQPKINKTFKLYNNEKNN